MKNTFLMLLLCCCGAALCAQTDSGYYTSFDGTKIFYHSSGSGKAVVLVHGFIVNGESWKRTELYRDLLNGGYRVIRFDMRGNGRSDKPHDAAAYANDAESKDIMGLLDYLKVKEYIVCGYSRGSIIAARLLLLDKRVTAGILGGMGDGFTDPQWPRRILFYRALSGEPVPELEGMLKYVKDSGLDQQALALLQKEQPSVTPDQWAVVNKPVLVICGDNDPDNGSPQNLAKMIKGSELKIVAGDHNNTLRTADYSKAVLDFIRRQ